MTSDRSAVVKLFRQELDEGSFRFGKVNDLVLESWLFQPGPDRLHLLQYCLGQLEPHLRGHFLICDEIEVENCTVNHVKSFGLSQNTKAILGTAHWSEQDLMWRRMLCLLKEAKEPESSQIEGRNPDSLPLSQTVTAIIKSKDFVELRNTKVKLLPTELRLNATAIPKINVEEELKAAVIRLEELQQMENSESSEDEKSTIDYSIQACEEYKEALLGHFKKIQECYDHIANTVLPAVKTVPESPIANRLGNCIENLADVTAFVQMMKSTEDIHRMAEMLLTNSFQEVKPSKIHQYLSKSHSLVTEILSLWRLHNMTNDN